MTATCKEDNSVKSVNISQIIYATNCQTLKFDYLRFTKSAFSIVSALYLAE